MNETEHTVEEIFAQAQSRQQADCWSEAEGLYRIILTAMPGHPEVLHQLGLCAHKAGNQGLAANLIRRALVADSDAAHFHNNLACALSALGQLRQAGQASKTAIVLQPDYGEAWGSFGKALCDLEKPGQAVACFDRFAAIAPPHPQALRASAQAGLQAAIDNLQKAERAAKLAMEVDAAGFEIQTLDWLISKRLGKCLSYFSQYGQDRFLDDHVFKGKRDGVFVDIGAFDGVTGSNTLFFEKFLNWRGLCVEPDPEPFGRLRLARSAVCVQCCVADRDGEAEFLRVIDGYCQMGGLLAGYDKVLLDVVRSSSATEIIKVPTVRLDHLLEKHGLHIIDYLSVDVEGSELDILKTIDFQRFTVRALSIENNRNSTELRDYLSGQGFKLLGCLGVDDLFESNAGGLSSIGPAILD